MTLGHFIYIPGMFLLGLLVGYILKGKVADAAQKESKEIDMRRRAREARRQAQSESQVRDAQTEAITEQNANLNPPAQENTSD